MDEATPPGPTSTARFSNIRSCHDDSTLAITERTSARHVVDCILALVKRTASVHRARRQLLTFLIEHGQADLDSALAAAELTVASDPRIPAVVPDYFDRLGIIERADSWPTFMARNRVDPIWRLRDHAAAETWLAEHPELPAIVTGDQLAPPLSKTKRPA